MRQVDQQQDMWADAWLNIALDRRQFLGLSLTSLIAGCGGSSSPTSVTGFSPTGGPVGTSVVIQGTQFTGATAVAFNGINASTFTVNSDTQITVIVPAGATSGLISVTAQGNTANSSTAFAVSGGGSIAAHPRIYLTASQMPILLQRAGYSAPGVPVAGATPAASWTTFRDYMQPYRTTGTYYGMQGWPFALMYKITNDTAYRDRALAFLTENMTAKPSGQFGPGNGATDPLDYAMSQYGGGVRFTNFIDALSYVQDAALIYDWLYQELTTAQRQQIVAYINRIIGELWDPLDKNPITYSVGTKKPWNAWGYNDSGDNFHYGHTSALIYAAAALGDPLENPNPPTMYFYPQNPTASEAGEQALHDYTSILAAVQARDAAYLRTYGKGGAWFEGDSYGNFCKSHMMEGMFVQSSAFGTSPASPPLDFVKDSSMYFLYAAQPTPDGAGPSGGSYNALTGDMPNYGQYLKDPERVSLLQEAIRLGSDETASYVRAWLQTKYPTCNAYRWLYAYDFLLDPTGGSVGDLSTLPPYYYSSGLGWVNSRSNGPRGLADPDAVSVMFWSADRIQSHQQEDANAFLVFYKDWQITKAAPYMTGNGFAWKLAEYQSNIMAADASGFEEERYSHDLSGGNGIPDTAHPSGKILKYESTPAYTYAVGDASDAYYTNVGGYGTGTTRLLNTYLREFVHIRPDIILLYDRVSPVATSTMVSHQIITHNLPTALSATDIRSINGAGEVFQRTLLPSSNFTVVSSEVVDDGTQTPGVPSCFRTNTQSTLTGAALTHQTFFHLLQTADASTSTMVATSSISEAAQKMNGVLIHTTGQDTAVLFAANNDGSAVTGAISYVVGQITSTHHIVFDLTPGSGYTITAAAGTLTLSPGGSSLVSTNGSLAFTTSAQGVVSFP